MTTKELGEAARRAAGECRAEDIAAVTALATHALALEAELAYYRKLDAQPLLGHVTEAKAGALEEAAEKWDAATNRDPGRGSAAFEEAVRPMRDEVSAFLRSLAADVRAGR